MWRKQRLQIILMTLSLGVCTHLVAETNSDAALAQELTNPIANLITVPVQMNFDRKIGLDDKGDKFFINVQPVIPVDVNDDWILITRTIVPLIRQQDVALGGGTQTGLGDINEQVFFLTQKIRCRCNLGCRCCNTAANGDRS